MFELDMNAIRQSARLPWLMANPANLANPANAVANAMPAAANDSQPLAKLAGIAKLAISHDLLTTRLMASAMRRCDEFKDSPTAREQMRQDVLGTPPHQRADLLDHFLQIYGAAP